MDKYILILVEVLLNHDQIISIAILGLGAFVWAGWVIYQKSPSKKFAIKKQELKDVYICIQDHMNKDSNTNTFHTSKCWTDISLINEELKDIGLYPPVIYPSDKNTWHAYSEWLLEIIKLSSSGNLKRAKKYTEEHKRQKRKERTKESKEKPTENKKPRPRWLFRKDEDGDNRDDRKDREKPTENRPSLLSRLFGTDVDDDRYE